MSKNTSNWRETSEQQITANRRNAVQSTGPRSADGKMRSRRNSLTNGLTARVIIVDDGDGQESAEEYEALLARRLEYWRPVGPEEDAQVTFMTDQEWLYTRSLRYEAGVIRQHADSLIWRYDQELQRKFESAIVSATKEESPEGMMTTSRGVAYLIRTLEEARRYLEREGRLSDSSLDMISTLFGGVNGGLFSLSPYQNFYPESTISTEETGEEKNPQPQYAFAPFDPSSPKEYKLKVIDDKIELLKTLRPELERVESLELEAKLAGAALPSERELNKILRYRSAAERGYHRALERLIGLRRARGAPEWQPGNTDDAPPAQYTASRRLAQGDTASTAPESLRS